MSYSTVGRQVSKCRHLWRPWLYPWTPSSSRGVVWCTPCYLYSQQPACKYSTIYSVIIQYCPNCCPYCASTVVTPNQVVPLVLYTHRYSGRPKYNPRPKYNLFSNFRLYQALKNIFFDFFLLKHKLQLFRNRIIQKNSNFFFCWVSFKFFFAADFFRRRLFSPPIFFAADFFNPLRLLPMANLFLNLE